jgi:hypothetical protein
MATYYVDLSVDTNPSFGINDPNNAMGYLEFKTRAGLGNLLYVKGVRDDSSTTLQFGGNGGCNIQCWGTEPWRLKLNRLNAWWDNGQLWCKGGIIETIDFSMQNRNGVNPFCYFLNCFIKTTNLEVSNVEQITTFTILGCNIIANQLISNTWGSVDGSTKNKVVSQDSVWAVNQIGHRNSDNTYEYTTPSFNASTVFDNCVFKVSSLTGYTTNNCEFSWISPTWPAWDGVQANYKYSKLFGENLPSYIPAALQPGYGSPTYTISSSNYATDLFGTARDRIGTGFFDSWPVIPDVPILNSPIGGVRITDNTPSLSFVIPSDGDNDNLVFQIEFDTNNVIDVNSSDYKIFESRLSQGDWKYWNGSSFVDMSSAGVSFEFYGNDVIFTIPNINRLRNAIWYWRVSVSDNLTCCVFNNGVFSQNKFCS